MGDQDVGSLKRASKQKQYRNKATSGKGSKSKFPNGYKEASVTFRPNTEAS